MLSMIAREEMSRCASATNRRGTRLTVRFYVGERRAYRRHGDSITLLPVAVVVATEMLFETALLRCSLASYVGNGDPPNTRAQELSG